MVRALAIIRPDKNLFNSEERVTYDEKDDHQRKPKRLSLQKRKVYQNARRGQISLSWRQGDRRAESGAAALLQQVRA